MYFLNCIQSKTYLKGIIVSNTSLQHLLYDMKKCYGLQYILTRKLDQDILENFFSFLKGMAGCASNNITVLDFKYW